MLAVPYMKGAMVAEGKVGRLKELLAHLAEGGRCYGVLRDRAKDLRYRLPKLFLHDLEGLRYQKKSPSRQVLDER